eukprot:scaffold94253_cov63-Phaeocystis_antarctica.AAC.1
MLLGGWWQSTLVAPGRLGSKRAPVLWWPHPEQSEHGIAASDEPVSTIRLKVTVEAPAVGHSGEPPTDTLGALPVRMEAEAGERRRVVRADGSRQRREGHRHMVPPPLGSTSWRRAAAGYSARPPRRRSSESASNLLASNRDHHTWQLKVNVE